MLINTNYINYKNTKIFSIILLSGFFLFNSTLISRGELKCAADEEVITQYGATYCQKKPAPSANELKCKSNEIYTLVYNVPTCVPKVSNSLQCGKGYEAQSVKGTNVCVKIEAGIAGPEFMPGTETQLLLPAKVETPVRSYQAQIKIPCQGLIDGKCADPETPAGFISRLYQFGLMVVGLAAFGSIVWGALQYILAAGNMGKVEDAKEIIQQAIYGIILLLGAYILLYTINPELVNLRNPKLEVIRIQSLAPPPEYNGLSQIGDNWGTGGIGVPAELCKWEVDAKITVNGKDKAGGTCLSCVDNAQKNSAGQCACIPEYAQYGATCIPMKKCLSEIGTLEGPGGTVCVQKQLCKLGGFTRNLDLGGACTKSTTKEQGCPAGSTLVSTSVEPEINPAFAKIYCREN